MNLLLYNFDSELSGWTSDARTTNASGANSTPTTAYQPKSKPTICPTSEALLNKQLPFNFFLDHILPMNMNK
jgi:hypothetical protein